MNQAYHTKAIQTEDVVKNIGAAERINSDENGF
jgi:hypothetical protein